MNTKEYATVPEPYPRKKRRLGPWVAGGILALAAGGLTYVPFTRKTETSSDPYPYPPTLVSSSPDGRSMESLCNTQSFSSIDGSFDRNTGTHTLFASSQRPSLFVVSPDRSQQQAFVVKAADPKGSWNAVIKDPSVGLVGLATSNTEFDTSGGKAVWTRACLTDTPTVQQEVTSHVKDLCDNPTYKFREVVVYDVGRDGKPQMKATIPC